MGRTEGKCTPKGGLAPGERTVQGSVTRSKRNGLIEVAVGGGRNKANTYRPLVDGHAKPHGQPWVKASEYLTARREVLRETSRLAAQNLTASGTKPHGQPCPLPNTSLNSSFAADRASIEPSSPAAKWQSVKKGLAKHPSVGNDAWVFDKLTVDVITDTEVVMVAPSTFVRHEIEKDVLHQRLTDAWRAELPTIIRVRLLDPPVARATQ